MKKASCSNVSGMLEGLIFACFHGVSLFGVFTREIWGGGKITYIVDEHMFQMSVEIMSKY